MTLTTRLSLFFLGALAVVLVGFSAALYALARDHLSRQVDERVTAALDTLDAAIDRDPAEFQWEGPEHQITLGREAGPEVVRWEVRDDTGKCLDRSANLGKGELGFTAPARDVGEEVVNCEGREWQIGWRRVRAPVTAPTARVPPRPAWLLLVVAVPVEPMEATLRQLLVTLTGLSAAVWLVAAAVGRWLCRRALAPVTRMATAARAMDATDLGQRLPGPASADELGELHRAFNGLLDRLQEAFERQRRFTGDASHQLRTPLTAMLGQVEVALRRDRPAEEYQRVLHLVRGQADHLRRIVEALLFLARADADAELARLEVVDLAVWLPEHLRTWNEHPRAGDLRLSAADQILVRVQPTLLAQLLDNLLDNACKYSPAGTPINVTVRRDAAAVELAVADAGQGIAADEVAHVFEPFFRSADARRRGLAGVGLGLAMAQRIAAALGGSLVVESELGRGSRFVVRIPPAPRE
jgi:heavy metal sensor kinase